MRTIKREQLLPISMDEAWEFFSSPQNLCKITPDWLCFDVRSGGDMPMYEGQIITYHIKPVLDITLTWVTEITHVREPYFFVDEQRLGPYAFWHHQHHFSEQDGGVLMKDEVNYALPFGLIGDVLGAPFVGRKLNKIFDYRMGAIPKNF